ncbi:MazG family protein, partial [Exiguobacterium aestuarii]|nr:MazG family protein [Exiguobacterium aestuarii]
MGYTITVVGLGSGELNQLPLGVYRHLKQQPLVWLRTKEHPVVSELESEGLVFESFD